MRTVIKRDGSEVRFNGEKIKRAILNAMLETTEGMDEKLAGDISQAIEKQVEKSQRTVNVAVSYTHLDVYKRQDHRGEGGGL